MSRNQEDEENFVRDEIRGLQREDNRIPEGAITIIKEEPQTTVSDLVTPRRSNRVLVVFSYELLLELDQARHETPRSAWIRRAVEERLQRDRARALLASTRWES